MPIEFKKATLTNGLNIVAEVNPQAHTAAAGFLVKAGARDETAELMGVSHFLEHMAFKGTPNRTAEQVNQHFDAIGANHNAMTGHETTTYYAHVLPEHIHTAIDILADIARPSLRQNDFDMEKNVILEEIGMYADQPSWVAMEQAFEDFFGQSPLGFRVLGTNETIANLTRDQMQSYFDRHYAPNNITVGLSGNIDFDRCVEQLNEATQTWQPADTDRPLKKMPPTPSDKTLTKPGLSMNYFTVICDGPSTEDDRRYAAAILSSIIGDSDGSRLYWELIDPGLADEADFSHHGFAGTGTAMGYASCSPKRAEEVESKFLHILDTAHENITEGEVQRAIAKIAMDLTVQNEKPLGRMMAVASQWLYLGQYLPFETQLQRINAITPDDVRQMLEDFPLNPRTIVRLKPE